MIKTLLFFLFSLPRFYLQSPLQFNQFYIQKLNLKHGIDQTSTLTNFILSFQSQKINQLLHQPQTLQEWPNNSQTAFDLIFSYLPLYTIVYPTEEFYYFTGQTGQGQKFAGNFRFADLSQGQLSFAFYPQGQSRSNQILKLNLNSSQGLKTKLLTNNLYFITWKNKTILVKLPNQSWIQSSPPLTLLPQEEFIGRIFDESGVRLFLIFNHQLKSFSMILDEQNLTEKLIKHQNNYYVGQRTDFIYLHDSNIQRKILIAVKQNHIQENDWLDGPGDQVPIHLNLKDKINQVYPNIQTQNIDQYGVYLNQENWKRVAISPYRTYSNLNETN